MHAVTAVVVSAVSLALVLSAVNAHSNGLDWSTCENFIVRHAENSQEDESKTVILELLLDNGNVTDCFWPQQDYRVRLTSDGFIKGFILQAVTAAKLPSPNKRGTIPFDTTWGPCQDTISHTQKRTDKSKDLIFPITTRRGARPLRFRYSVVFSLTSFQQNRYVDIPCCHLLQPGSTPSNETNATNPEDLTGNYNATGSTTEPQITILEPLGTLVEGHCGKKVMNVNVSYNDTHNGIRYNCSINRPLKKTNCTEACDLNGQPVVCQIFKHIRRRKGYTCTAYRDGDQEELDIDHDVYNTIYEETVTTGCQCFAQDSGSA